MDNKNKIAIMVGAGAVENAWHPILQILNPMIRGGIDSDVANCFFARMIYLLKMYSSLSDENSVANLKDQVELVKDIKALISDAIKNFQKAGILKPRKEFEEVMKKFVFTDSNNLFGLVSTNWDTVIDKEINKLVNQYYIDLKSARCFHIHGSIDDPDHLYLPSETSQERYRSTEDNVRYSVDHWQTSKFLNEARQIILYGISLDPLDAELSQILSSTFTVSNYLNEVIIINPDFEKVRKRVKALLFPKYDLKVKCFLPENLDYEV